MHLESITVLAKSLAIGVGVTAAATIGKLPVLFGQAVDAADIGNWGKIVAEYGVLVGLAIYFLWRDWRREQQAESKAKEALELAHSRELATIEASKERDSAQFRSREAREAAMKDQWMHSERRREALELKLLTIIDHMLRMRDKQAAITDTDKFEPIPPENRS